MRLHYQLKRESQRPLVLAIGFFDGMHRGHREIARQTLRLRKPGWRAGVLTFSNHPAQFLRPGTQPPFITTNEERLCLLAKAGYEECFFVPFDDSIASLDANAFLEETLIRDLGARGVVVGNTFRFGHQRSGDTKLMQKVLSEAGVAFKGLENITDAHGERISSTRIRNCISAGNTQEADELLGHAYELRGKVISGEGRGHALDFPTANLALPDKLMPKDGVYAAVARYDGRDYASLVSIGTKPTFDGKERAVEVWLRDFHHTIYGQELAVRDFRFIREQASFETTDELRKQMRADAEHVAYPSYG